MIDIVSTLVLAILIAGAINNEQQKLSKERLEQEESWTDIETSNR